MLLTLAVLLLADRAAIDGERAAWQYRRQVTIAGNPALASLILPPELSTRAAAHGRDFRLVDDEGREIPFLLDWTSEREGFATWRANVKDVRREKETAGSSSPVRSEWTLDLGAVRTFTDLSLNVPDVAFAWHVRVESSLDGSRFETALNEASLFDQTWNNERVRKTDIRFDAPLSARYLRVTARSAASSETFELTGASVTLRRRLKGDTWTMAVPATLVDSTEGRKSVSRYQLSASSLLPFDEVEMESQDPTFSRRVRLIEVDDAVGRKTETVLGQGQVFRLRATDALVAYDAPRFPTRNGSGGALFLEVENASSPPLRGLRVRVHGSRVRLLFPVSSRSLTLYYGNETTRAPAYDLESLRPRLVQALGTETAGLMREEANPLFKREPPLRFAATLGASLDSAGWHHQRPLSPIREEDVYTSTLRASDLTILRPDLADLRVVDDENRQVPFLIDREFAEERVPLNVRKQATASPHRSVFELSPATPLPGNKTPDLTRIELDIADAFFDRRARLLHSANQGQREVPFSISLARRPPGGDPLVVGLVAPLGTLSLEVDDGDNAPLDIKAAVGIVRVPRVVFKAAPGTLRLLLGNPAAEAPRYDIAGLRSELLAYSAVVASVGPLTENQGARTSVLSLLDGAPRGALVWGAIIVAIVALVALTVRTLKGTS